VLLGVSSSSEGKVLYLPSPFIQLYFRMTTSGSARLASVANAPLHVTFLFLDLPLDDILCINSPVWGYNFIESYHVAMLCAKQSLDMFVKYPI